jgi:hypothetical protein
MPVIVTQYYTWFIENFGYDIKLSAKNDKQVHEKFKSMDLHKYLHIEDHQESSAY